MNPASVMKLLTTYAGLELLGPAYTWKTEIYTDAPPVNGVISGPLYLKGHGDPKLSLENFWRLTRRLKQAGITDIRGGLVLDGSFFGERRADPGLFDNRAHRAYNVGPEALLVHYRVVALRLLPDLEGGNVRVVADPQPGSLEIRNHLRLAEGPCNSWRDALKADIQTGSRPVVAFNGTYSAECGEKEYLLNLYDQPDYVLGVFRELWQQQGGSLDGGVREGQVPAAARLILSFDSPPLAEVVRDINKHSNNVMARNLLLTLGARDQAPGTLAGARAAIREWLKGKGLAFNELVIENGAGLSRQERISARHLADLLLAAHASPVMPELMASLPLNGLDGTMKKRLMENGNAGRMRIKTGLLDEVKTLAGYVLDKKGRQMVVVCLINHPRAGAGQAAQDALLEWVLNRP
jgi:D-alanyl-D-alanine carboxypeptidase/D-alanyl-D-alanine-endopeptidase (penicillin-binding protein 4)